MQHTRKNNKLMRTGEKPNTQLNLQAPTLRLTQTKRKSQTRIQQSKTKHPMTHTHLPSSAPLHPHAIYLKTTRALHWQRFSFLAYKMKKYSKPHDKMDSSLPTEINLSLFT
jgi:hypothetical protein